MGKTREYSNGEVTIVWEAKKCIHSGICVKGLPQVFRPSIRPWISIDKASTEDLVKQVKSCPSGALSFFMNDAANKTAEKLQTEIEVLENGPLLVYGTVTVTDKNGAQELRNRTTAFCRCGQSGNKPFCDGAHVKNNFEG